LQRRRRVFGWSKEMVVLPVLESRLETGWRMLLLTRESN
jgi:hypothetical protein